MEIFFGDESTQRGARDGMGKLVAFGGVFVSEDQLRPLSEAIDQVAKAYGIPDGTELKWSPPKGNWIRDNLVDQARRDCYSEVLEKARDHQARAIVVALDTGRTTVKDADAFAKALDWSWERIEMHLASIGRLGLMVADRPGGGPKEDEEFLEDFLLRMTAGTAYVPPARIPINILTTPSHLVRGLQLADMVVGVTTSAVVGNEHGLALIDRVTPLFITNSLGTIGGTGLKLFPNELVNLYHHVLGETTFAKAAQMSGYGLPLDRWSNAGPELPYFSSDGRLYP